MSDTRSGTSLQGVISIRPMVHADSRGHFLETFSRARYSDLGIDIEFVQDNHSRSGRGVVRGLHFQTAPGQPKLVRVAHGRAWDVIVDLRRSSPTFGKWEAFELDDIDHRQLFIPVGFAHGFCALSETVDFVYKVGSYYAQETERGVAWDDPDIGIPWPIGHPVISDRDRVLPRLRDLEGQLPSW